MNIKHTSYATRSRGIPWNIPLVTYVFRGVHTNFL